jgi:hypothetical protein
MERNNILPMLLASGLLKVVQILDVPSDGACFFHCLIAGLSRVSMSFFTQRQIPSNSEELRRFICENLRRNPKVMIPGLGISPLEYFITEYSKEAKNRQHLHNSYYNQILVGRGQDPLQNPLYVDTFEKYLEWMEHPNTQVDDLVVGFTALILGLNATVYRRPISEVSEDSEIPQVEQLISMGFKKSVVEEVLARTQGNVEQALEILLQMDSASAHVQQPAQQVWHAQYYPNRGIKMCFINDRSHFQLVVPDEVSDAVPVSQQAQVRAEQILQLPDISDELSKNDQSETQHLPTSPQIRTCQQLYDFCNLYLQKCSKLPTLLRLDVHIARCIDGDFVKLLLERFIFPDCGMVNYRIVCFTFDDETRVAHDVSIDQLSHSGVKMQFFRKLWNSITLKSVTRVVFERC